MDRRTVLGGVGSTLFLALLPRSVLGAPDEMRAVMRTALGPGPIGEGRVQIDVPALVENGNSVPLTLSVESPMTREDHATSIYVFSPENPLPIVSRFILGPRNGKAVVRTSIRLATSQSLHVVAVMSDGSRWGTTAEIEVTTAACFDPT